MAEEARHTNILMPISVACEEQLGLKVSSVGAPQIEGRWVHNFYQLYKGNYFSMRKAHMRQ